MVAGTNRTNRGRDGCRVPLPWTRGGESHGFSPDGPDEPWLPQPAVWGDGTLEWIDAGPDVVAFRREPGSECWTNLVADPVPMPQGQVLVASAEAHAGTIPTDVAVWLQIG
jgi:alpha-glucosidase